MPAQFQSSGASPSEQACRSVASGDSTPEILRRSYAAAPRASNRYVDAISVTRHKTSKLTRLNTNALGGRRAEESRRFDFTSVERRRASQSAAARHAFSDGRTRVGRTHVL